MKSTFTHSLSSTVKVFFRLWVAILLSPLFQAGCASASDLSKIGSALDEAQNHLDEYGTITISAPVLTYAQSNEFLFTLSNGPAYYFNDDKTNTQGQAAIFSQALQNIQVSAQAQGDSTVSAAYMAATHNYLLQQNAYQLQQDSLKQAANLQLQAAEAQAATNTSPGGSNAVMAAAIQTYANTVYGSNASPPTFPMASSFDTNLPTPPAMLNNTNNPQLIAMLPFLSLLNSPQPNLNVDDRSALLEAAGDSEIENFFRSIGNSADFGNFVNSEIYFGITTVSIDPGWRTSKGWQGEVNVTAELEFKDARRETVLRILNNPVWPSGLRARIAEDYGYPVRIPDEMRRMGVTCADELANVDMCAFPDEIPYSLLMKTTWKPVQVIVISPMVESENFDMASSYRLQNQLAISLAAAMTYAGAKAQAKTFMNFVKSRQSDFATRNSLALVNAFSDQDGAFGFQIGPQPQALTDPVDKNSGPGSVLGRQSFPALLVFSMSRGDIEPRVTCKTNADSSIVFRVVEPYLSLRQTRRWIPLQRSFFSVSDWYRPRDWFDPELREKERIKTVNDLENVAKNIDDLPWHTELAFGTTYDDTGLPGHYSSKDAVRERVAFFERALIGTINYISLPYNRMVPQVASEQPSVFEVAPSGIKLQYEPNGDLDLITNTFVLKGTNLDTADLTVTSVYPNLTNLTVLFRSPGAYVIQAVVTSSDYPITFQIYPPKSSTTQPSLSPSVIVNTTKLVPQVLDVEPKEIMLTRATNGAAGSVEPTNVDIVMIGSGLKRIDIADATVATGYASLKNLQLLGDGLKATLYITNAGQAVSLLLPDRDLPAPGLTNFVLSRPVQVDLDELQTNAPPKPATNSPAGGLQPYASITFAAVPASAANTTNAPIH